MTPETPQRYRRLPGRLRRVLRGSSVWAGPDHLLLVRSSRFGETYKRFYYRDVQAIAVADAPRFHISTRAIVIFALWFWAAALTANLPKVSPWVIGSGLVFPLVWAGISWIASCRCRIYTAVSSDELPSVYRRWTARKFLKAVEPLMAQAQGVLDANWAGAAENRDVGPAYATLPESVAKAADSAPSRTWASDLMIFALLADAALRFVVISNVTATRWTSLAVVLGVGVGAVFIMIQRQRQLIQGAMQKLAICTLVAMGLIYYGQAIAIGAMAGINAQKGKATVISPIDINDASGVRKGAGVLYAILAIVGLTLSLRTRDAAPLSKLE